MDSQQLEYWAQVQNHHYLSASETALELPPDLSQTPSLSASPVSETGHWALAHDTSALIRRKEMSEFESFASPTFYQSSFPHMGPDDVNFTYPMTPSEFGSADDSYSKHAHQMNELAYPHITSPITTGASIPVAKPISARSTHATSGRRRAQNRAAQRAFRERKEKHAKDLEEALSALTTKYEALETSHSELSAAYEKLRKMIELLTKDDDDDGGQEAKLGNSKEILRKLLKIIHGEVDTRGASAKE